ncbi:formate dehydrogenase subunit delta [Dongia rigui]|uniref:Formate dehydrogenase subunit delta n=1 Tax=Dongia rigui TaxID=940149 RepID=A0ABU5DY99_9PROT|nr:formate dehydrogenase subunit delta [Dongia rigui]MDY0872203.1 formate dehydrogenase subunit delta [Dongia rigui]
MNDNRLVSMANQIADFFQSYPESEAIEGIAVHIEKFWDPRMRRGIYAHLNAGGADLKPLTRKALQKLAAKQPDLAKSA